MTVIERVRLKSDRQLEIVGQSHIAGGCGRKFHPISGASNMTYETEKNLQHHFIMN